MMRRRDLLSAGAGVLVMSKLNWARDIPDDLVITRIVSFDLKSRRPRILGKNARRDVHGVDAKDRLVRLYTNIGVDGFGYCRADEKTMRPLLGTNPLDYLDMAKGVGSPFGAETTPIWDLAGKILGKPVYALLSELADAEPAKPQSVSVYDGSIYFSDLLPENADKSVDIFKEEIDAGLKRGHRRFKVKIGRGGKWMPKEEGFQRDVAVLRTIRAHAGRDVEIAVDANDGMGFEQTKRLMLELPDYNFLFMEEMWPATTEEYLQFKAFINENKWSTLIGDGENNQRLEDYAEWLEHRAVDILQGDILRFGFEGIVEEAKQARKQGMYVATHNWGSLVGFYMQIHLGRALSNFFSAEEDPLSTPALLTDGFRIKDGRCAPPDAPGIGLVLDEKHLADHIDVHYDIKR